MAYLEGIAVYVVLLLAIVSITIGFVDAKIYLKIKKASKEAMAKLKLQPDKTKREFKLLFFANFVMIPALGLFAYGSITDEDIYRNIGRVGFTVFAAIILYTQYSWWRRL